jgi:cysteine desulfurase
MEPSHVLAAMGVPTRLAQGAVRLTLGTTTTAADVDRGAQVLIDGVRRLRRGTGLSAARPAVSTAS